MKNYGRETYSFSRGGQHLSIIEGLHTNCLFCSFFSFHALFNAFYSLTSFSSLSFIFKVIRLLEQNFIVPLVHKQMYETNLLLLLLLSFVTLFRLQLFAYLPKRTILPQSPFRPGKNFHISEFSRFYFYFFFLKMSNPVKALQCSSNGIFRVDKLSY